MKPLIVDDATELESQLSIELRLALLLDLRALPGAPLSFLQGA